MINVSGLLTSFSVTTPPNLSGFHYNRDILKAAVANTYVETVSNISDSLYLAIEDLHHPQ